MQFYDINGYEIISQIITQAVLKCEPCSGKYRWPMLFLSIMKWGSYFVFNYTSLVRFAGLYFISLLLQLIYVELLLLLLFVASIMQKKKKKKEKEKNWAERWPVSRKQKKNSN